MLADAEHIEPDLVGQRHLLDQVAQPLRWVEDFAGGGVGGVFNEGVDADFHEARAFPGESAWSLPT